MFNCPANLASHRRWHKPRQNGFSNKNVLSSSNNKNKFKNNGAIINDAHRNELQNDGFMCKDCGKSFRRSVYFILNQHFGS